MLITNYQDVDEKEVFPGVFARNYYANLIGSENVSMLDIFLKPNSEIPLHIHPSHEEIIVVLSGSLIAYVSDDQTTSISAGNVIVVSESQTHKVVNDGDTTAHLLGIFPTKEPERVIV